MDTWRISSCLTGQSMATKDICILVVHNDPMYRNIIVEMLENCSHYEVKRYETAASALNIIEGKKEGLNIIITDIHRSHSNGFEIINYIEKEFKLPVISMIPRQNAGVVPVGPDSDATLYFVKSLSVTEFKTHWQHAYTEEKGKTSFQSVSVVQEGKTGTSLQIYSSVHEVIRKNQNDKKRKVEEADDQSEDDKYDISNGKKPRVIWNEELHHKFVKAVELLGLDSAVPKKILEIMKVPALTRENVASHLQKYRMSLKCAKEEMQSTSSIYGINSTPVRYFQSKHSGFISSQPNHQRYHTQNPLLRSYQPRLSPFNVPNFSSLETSNSTSNLGKQQLSYAHNSFLVSNTQSIMRPINTNMPLSNWFSSYPEASTTTSNLGQQNFVTVNNNQVSLMFPNTHNSHVIDTTQIHSSPLPNENPQPNSLNNTRYVGLGVTTNGELADCDQTRTPNINADMEDNRTSFHEGNGNERLVQFLSTELDNNAEQQLYVPPAAEINIEDLLDEIDGITIPDFDFDDMLV